MGSEIYGDEVEFVKCETCGVTTPYVGTKRCNDCYEVEKRLRDAVKNDRARVQIGKISQFGLLEMSRQRLRAGVIAGSTVTCPHCAGTVLVRSIESTALRVLRGLRVYPERMRRNVDALGGLTAPVPKAEKA